MSKIILQIFLLLFLQSFSYDYFKEIEVNSDNKYQEFFLTEDIYLNSKNGLNDIRILDSQGQEVPYVIEKKDEQYNNIERIVSIGDMISEVIKEDKIETLFKFSPKNKLDDIVGNRIEITSIGNFYSEYELLGSYNGKNWEYISYGEIYKNPHNENLVVSFSQEKYTYYKLITNLSKESNFKGAILKFYESEKYKIETTSLKLHYQSEKKDKTTLITIKTNNLPLHKINLKVNGEFKRNYVIKSNYYDRSGTIFRVGDKTNTEIALTDRFSAEQLILEINNKDNKPLSIEEIHGEYVPSKIMFKSETTGKYKVTFGDENLSKPKYDLEDFHTLIKERTLVTIGKLNILEKDSSVKPQKPKDLSIYYNIFIGLIVLLLICFMIIKINKKK
ncbi:MAG: hypothetical protein ACRC0S_09885 [Fusobacteriaceae bacterium]